MKLHLVRCKYVECSVQFNNTEFAAIIRFIFTLLHLYINRVELQTR